MRADRLISIVMLLQTRGQMTAESLAQELSVSKRTIYRDIDALSASGIPIYADGGPGGGYALLDSYRTTLNGLTQEEIRALFLLITPDSLAGLGIDQYLKSAVLKLTSALPARHYSQPDFIRGRFYIDPGGWFQSTEPVPHLDSLQQVVWSDRQIEIKYRPSSGETNWRRIAPLGLVAKSNIWYLVADTQRGRRVYRVARILEVKEPAETFQRDPAFDLTTFWKDWVQDYELGLPQYPVTIRISPDLFALLPLLWGEKIQTALDESSPDADGWRVIIFTFERFEEALARTLALGAAVEVLAPQELRTAVSSAAIDTAALYTSPGNPAFLQRED